MRTLLCVGLLAVSAMAACPNQCSGHGRCGAFDKCTCYKQAGSASPYRYGYTGVDCSLRTCPYAPASGSIGTQAPSLSPVVFTSFAGVTNEHLRVFYNPGNRSSSFQSLRRDQTFSVQIMSTSTSNPSTVGTFTWKFDEDEYYEPETTIASASSEAMPRPLSKVAATSTGTSVTSTGVFVWWDATFKGSAGFTSGGVDDISVGDVYTFTLSYNEGVTFDLADGNTAHQILECSGRGVCDYTAGKCVCAPGFTGEACQRSVCHNGCSGHGSCQAQARFVTDALVPGGTYAGGYDGAMEYGCKCDSGYRGADCSMMQCPSGADVLGGDGGAQGRDCSGRGMCDYTSGVCKCFKGFYGERCESMTNLA